MDKLFRARRGRRTLPGSVIALARLARKVLTAEEVCLAFITDRRTLLYHLRPESRERIRAEWNSKIARARDRFRERYRTDPQFRERTLQKSRDRYRGDQAFRERVRARSLKRHYRMRRIRI